MSPNLPTKPQKFSHSTIFTLITSMYEQIPTLVVLLSPHHTQDIPTDSNQRTFVNAKLKVLQRMYTTLLRNLAQFNTEIFDAHDSHDSHQRQLEDYQTHFFPPLANHYTETYRNNTHQRLHTILHYNTALADIINTPRHFIPINSKYVAWLHKLTTHHIPDNESPSLTRRRYNLLRTSLKHTNHIHTQLQKFLFIVPGCQRNKMIDHKLNISLLNEAFHMVHPKRLIIPQLCATTTMHQTPGKPH